MTNSPNTQPIFIRTPNIWSITLRTEIGSTDPSATFIPKTLAIGADPASAIEIIEICPTGLMVSTELYLYLYDSVGTQGQNRLISRTVLPEITTYTASDPIVVLLPATLSPASSDPALPNRILRLPSGWELRAALANSIVSPIIVTAFGGNYY